MTEIRDRVKRIYAESEPLEPDDWEGHSEASEAREHGDGSDDGSESSGQSEIRARVEAIYERSVPLDPEQWEYQCDGSDS
jgi:hypothetical protein